MQVRERPMDIFMFLSLVHLALPSQLKPQILPLFLQMFNVLISSLLCSLRTGHNFHASECLLFPLPGVLPS